VALRFYTSNVIASVEIAVAGGSQWLSRDVSQQADEFDLLRHSHVDASRSGTTNACTYDHAP
jgi:hypothetical protein